MCIFHLASLPAPLSLLDSCPDETEEDVEESNPPDLNAGECLVKAHTVHKHMCN